METGKKLWRWQNRKNEEMENEGIRRAEEFGRIRKYKERAVLKHPLWRKSREKMSKVSYCLRREAWKMKTAEKCDKKITKKSTKPHWLGGKF